MHLKPIGLIVVAASLLAPLYWLQPLASKFDSAALFSQYLGIVALIAMSLGQIIATRLRLVETLFGGLDRGYILHKWLGIGAMVAILLHDTIDAEMDGLGRENFLTDIAETAGEISLYGILILVVITIATFIPYQLWRWTHKILGVFFVFSALHYLFILKPFSNFDPVGWYVSIYCLLGILAFVYKLAPSWLRRSYSYIVTDIQNQGDAVAVSLKPVKRALKYRAGQFAFFTFGGSGLSEAHPFTISKAPDQNGELRVTVAALGDYTSQLPQRVALGSTVSVEGPFGRFEKKSGKNPQIWVAAGIGVTPFVAWAQSLTEADGQVLMFYCVRSVDEAVHVAELQRIADQNPNFTLVLHESQVSKRLTAKGLMATAQSQLAVPPQKMQVYFCGPKSMRKTLITGLAKLGVAKRRVHFEEFEIRSGIGLRALFQLLRNQLEARAKNSK
ncbi:MAG: ferredoxin reductase family protein [Alphaproteobacteria bacterium]